jgi:glycosyltransferase involved in cell wall biosynthesis
MARIAVVSFRLGGTDGVSIEAAKWMRALGELGHDVTSVAGDGIADHLVTGLSIGATSPPSRDELNAAFDGAALVVVENLASLPLNIDARDMLYATLDGRDALFHHHDLPWQRPQFALAEGPRDQSRWQHVTINDLSRLQLAQRGIDATTVMNSFDCDPPLGERERTREALHLDRERLILLPTRAIPRKNIEGALKLAMELNAVLWILGPAEDGYSPKFEELLRDCAVPTRLGMPKNITIDDAYAACDLVVMPSTWEGFGNPVLESVTHRRPLAVNDYPVLREIESYGFVFFKLDEVSVLDRFLRVPDNNHFETNLNVAREHFNVKDLPRRLSSLLKLDESDVRESVDTPQLRC